MAKPFKYRVRRTGTIKFIGQRGVQRQLEDPKATAGIIQGEKASDLEIMFGRALDKINLPYDFRVRITSQALGAQRLTHTFANIEGEVEIDFLVQARGLDTPIFIDGQIGHFFTPYQADKDRTKTIITDDFGKNINWRPSVRVPFWELTSQDAADRRVRELFL